MTSKNKLGHFGPEVGVDIDNLSIILCTYFSDHMERPESDEATEGDDNGHWGDWVVDKVDKYIDKLVEEFGS